jgi:N-acyl-D-amino-acid deacylase
MISSAEQAGVKVRVTASVLLLAVLAGGLSERACSQDVPRSLIVNGPPVSGLPSFDEATARILELTGAPGAALAVARDGRLVLAKGYGYADIMTREPVSPTSRFRIASVSKPITAVATMKLVEEGRLSLDDRVVEVLDFELSGSDSLDPRVRDITVGDLLYHSGGWDRERSGFDPPFAADRIAIALGEPPPADASQMVRFMLRQELDFDPGSRQVYSNVGYAMLGRVIEAVTGEPYEQHVQRAVFEPAGVRTAELARSFREQRAPNEVRYHDDRVFLSMFPGRGMVSAPYGAFAIETMDAHGGWIASAPDLLRFMTHVDLDPTVPDLLEHETVESMVSPHASASADSTFYARGWEILRHRDGVVWYHRGDLPGTTALLACTGRTQFAFLMNGNVGSRENADRLLPMLLEAARNVKEWPDSDLFPEIR